MEGERQRHDAQVHAGTVGSLFMLQENVQNSTVIPGRAFCCAFNTMPPNRRRGRN